MQSFNLWPEQRMRVIRWSVLFGWGILILSLLWPGIGINGNNIFWGSVVPGGLFIIAAISHELWRRICPLAFVSQLARALDRQRRRPGRGGKPEIVKVQPDSWLGRHHIELQWSLLIAGLCLRLLAVNNSPLALAVLLLGTVAAALTVGWAYGGKTWCQYICPMGPVQQIVTAERSPLGSTAHMNNSTRITQSMCRTISSDGLEQSACVACQKNCMDIDAERSFWENLQGKRGLDWAWSSYLGLIIGFFLLLRLEGSGDPANALSPLSATFPVPRLIAFPAILLLSALISVYALRLTEGVLENIDNRQGQSEPSQRARQHIRQLATFLAVNTFFFFTAPLQGMFGEIGDTLVRYSVLALTSISLFRGWKRGHAVYRRESTSDNLRKKLKDLPGLDAALDGRSLEALTPDEVFTLVKALPAIGQQKGKQIYADVMTEMLQSGRLNHATALLELEELRHSLGLSQDDHHLVLQLVSEKQPGLLNSASFERQTDELRREAAREQIEELIRVNGLDGLTPSQLTATAQADLELLRQGSGLDDKAWEECLQSFGAKGVWEKQRLEKLSDRWRWMSGLQGMLLKAAKQEPLFLPLANCLNQRQELLRHDLNPTRVASGLEPLPESIEAHGSTEEALNLLWLDPCPDTAGWILMLDQLEHADRSARPIRETRDYLGTSEFLEKLQRSELDPELRQCFRALMKASLFDDLTPEGILWLVNQGPITRVEPGEIIVQKGETIDHMSIVVRGTVELIDNPGEQKILNCGETLGELNVIIGTPQPASGHAGQDGAVLFTLHAQIFDELLRRSPGFNRGLIRELAERSALAEAKA
jgi:polyferredoxin